MIDTIVNTTVAGNEVWRWVLFCVALLCSLVIGRLASFSLSRLAKRNFTAGNELRGVFLRSLSRSMLILWVAVAAFAALHSGLLLMPEFLEGMFNVASGVLFSSSLGYTVYCLVDIVDYKLGGIARRSANKVDDMLMPMVGKSLRITIVVLVILQVVQILSGQPLPSILAGLGVGGLAVALAGQDTIKNFFGAVVIIGDKPFEIGDRIVIDGYDGPVESVGFRSTKLRTLDGHLVSVPNSSVVNTTIQNISKRPYIKHVANIGITYDTPPDKVDAAVKIIKDILHNHEGMNADYPPRVFFNAFNDWSLNILVIFWYHPAEYWKYLEFVERFNRELLKCYNEADISFAFPSQTLYMSSN